MKDLVRKSAAFAAALLCFGAASAQERAEKTAEEEYLGNVEEVFIAELASGDRESKWDALTFAEAAAARGAVTEGISRTVQTLAGETVLSRTLERGRTVNNYPEIRAKACGVLGNIPSEDVINTLKKVAFADNEPMVAAAAIRALGEAARAENNDDIAETIVWTEKKFAVLQPVSSLALETLAAFEKLAATLSAQERGVMMQSISGIARNSDYVLPVRVKAQEVIKSFISQDKP